MHLIGSLLHPLEESIDPVPLAVLPEFLAAEIRTLFSCDHETLIRLGQLLKGKMHIDVRHGTGLQKISLTLARLTTLEGFHHTAGDAQGTIRHDPVIVEADHPAETAAVGTGAKGIVEAEETRHRRPDIKIAMGAMPARRVRELLATVRINQSDPILAESQGGFDRLGEAPAVLLRDGQTILDDLHDGGQVGQLRRLIRSMDASLDPDPEISLLLEEGEEVGR